jgi:putative heme-binding domain-containing protein
MVAFSLPAPCLGQPARSPSAQSSRFQLPPGFTIEKVAGPPLVRYPLFAALDDQGRLFVAEGTGTNLPGNELVSKKLGRITLLEDTGGDGEYDKSTVFADQLVFPTGVLWHDGVLYATSHPSLWRFQDSKGAGEADRREELVRAFNFNGNGCDIHGPFLGLDGRLYWTDGRHGYKILTPEGECLEGLASRIWRCRTDGSDIERLCGGGFDNPVELAFTAEGDIIGTMDQGPGDCLLHYVEGGVYPMEHPCLKEFPMTGPLLGPIRQYSAALPVALCGLAHYRSTQFGPDYPGALFTAQFNVHRIERHTLVRDGATFRSIDKDFLTSSDYNTHFTDVLEDADGSLLVVDMGAWFNYGCPTSKIAKPEVLGAIYRIRRQDAPSVSDPWGRSLKLATRTPAQLAKLLDDPRPKVCDQVLTQLAKHGPEAIAVLRQVICAQPKHSVVARRNAVWALCRMREPGARAAIREALGDQDASVRQAAVHAAGLERDAGASAALMELVVKDEPPIRLKAAEALGRIGRSDAVPPLLASVRRGGLDRFLEHALIYALLRINDPKAIRPALDDFNPRVRQAVLVALDQIKDSRLTREQVVPLLDTDDPELQQTALAVISRHPEWSRETIGLLEAWLGSSDLSPGRERSLLGALLAFGADEDIQRVVAKTLAETKTPPAARLLLLRMFARSPLDQLPKSWLDAVREALASPDHAICREAIATVKARNLAYFDSQLLELSRREALPAEVRLAALDCMVARQKKLSPEAFTLLISHLAEKTEPLLRITAARALGTSTLDGPQLLQLVERLAAAGPVTVPLAIPAFTKSSDPKIGIALMDALKRLPGGEALTGEDLDKLLKNYPAEVQAASGPLRSKLAARQKEQADYLARLTTELLQTKGSLERGKEVFFSKKAACYGCHRAAGKGGSAGPDLSQVGRYRSPRDLLESVVFPSSSIVPEFRSYVVRLTDGRVVTGMIARETADAIHLRTADLAEVRVPRKDVEDMTSSKVSLMPEGLEKVMTRQELADLLEFLYHQR